LLLYPSKKGEGAPSPSGGRTKGEKQMVKFNKEETESAGTLPTTGGLWDLRRRRAGKPTYRDSIKETLNRKKKIGGVCFTTTSPI